MTDFFYELFRSVETIWIAWALGLAGLAVCVRILSRTAPRRSWRELGRSEDGASYSLGYIITIPFFILIICLVVETTLILVAKIGTTYAAYAAARSSVVWHPSGVGPSEANSKMTLSAVQAMVPFASSDKKHRPLTSIPSPTNVAQYYAAHRAFAEKPGSPQYIAAKYHYADWAVSVTSDAGMDSRQDVTVTLQYKAPFHLSAIGRFLGEQSFVGGFYYYPMTTVVKLENHAPRTDNSNPSARPLGISYVPAP